MPAPLRMRQSNTFARCRAAVGKKVIAVGGEKGFAGVRESGTPGAFSDLATRQSAIPALRFDNPKPNGVNYVKFDGYEELPGGEKLLLIDAKRTLPFWNHQAMDEVADTIDRVKAALKQNSGYKAVWEFPTEVEAEKARGFMANRGLASVLTVRVRAR